MASIAPSMPKLGAPCWVPWPPAPLPWLGMVHPVGYLAPSVSNEPKSLPQPAPRASREGEGAIDALMNRYAQGDDAAFAELYTLMAPRLRGFLVRLTGAVAVADELAQEVFLRLHRSRGAFAEGAAALPWMYTLARNVFFDQQRQRKVRKIVVGDDDSMDQHADVAGLRPDQVALARDTLAVVKDTLASLPIAQREAFVLLRFEGLSVSEAALVLGTTESSVKARAFRAYEALRLATKDSRGEG